MAGRRGAFVISLDFELYWGVRDKVSLERYRGHLEGAREAIPRLLDLFVRRGVHATWATVGFLFYETREQLEAALPSLRPEYARPELSPYPSFHRLGDGEADDPFHFAPSLIRRIAATPGQEVGSHTFSHYYCLERGQTVEAFRQDLARAVEAARRLDVRLQSVVFPRNQAQEDYLPVCREFGFRAYRGPTPSPLYEGRNEDDETVWRRALRTVDAYVPLTRDHSYETPQRADVSEPPLNLPASRFLRPFTPRLAWAEPLRLGRVRREIETAARAGRVYHLWWHPHNFGARPDENLAALDTLLAHVERQREERGMRCLTMAGLADEILEGESS